MMRATLRAAAPTVRALASRPPGGDARRAPQRFRGGIVARSRRVPGASPARRRFAALTRASDASDAPASVETPLPPPPSPASASPGLGVRSSGAVLVPHPDKAEKGGEDACFVLRELGAFGVMDGVGGWADEGVDPAAYSNTFAEKAAAAVIAGERDPRAVIARAHERVEVVGSATACVAVLSAERERSSSAEPGAVPSDGTPVGTVHIGNLGDAGAMIARDGASVFSTPAQQHEFNCPFQLGWREFYPESDRASDAEVFAVDVRPGDALIMGSDGLWDNVPPREVAEVCAACVGRGETAQETAEAIASRAFEHSVDEAYDSPFTMEARRNGYDVEWWEKAQGKELVGGKMDDIAVVVAFLDDAEKCPAPAPEEGEEGEEGEEDEEGEEEEASGGEEDTADDAESSSRVTREP